MGASVQSNPGASPREGGSSSRRLWAWLAALIALLVLLGIAALVLYARGGGPLPSGLSFLTPSQSSLLAKSSPAEAALRALRLAGIDRAVVGSSGGTAIARVEIPSTASAADVSVAWQAAVGALVTAYPTAETYVVQLFAPGALPLAEAKAPGDAARKAVAADDVAALRASSSITYLGSGGGR